MYGTYARLEPRTRSDSLEPGIAARVRDAAWMLGRQWVLGELDGDDAGTPIAAKLELESHAVSLVRIGGFSKPYSADEMPLDAAIERMPTHGPSVWTLRQRLDAGLALIRALRELSLETEIAEVIGSYPLELADELAATQPNAVALRRLAQGRAPDGQWVLAELDNVGANWTESARGVLHTWASAQEGEVTGPETSAWNPERLEYSCSVDVSGWGRLQAQEHRGVRMDWYSFDLGSAPALTAATTKPIEAVPTPIRFAGMPQPRYWTFENANVDLGSVDASATDLARMALIQFAFAYGNDAFMIPVRLPVGSVSRIPKLTVMDVFGQEVQVTRASRPASPNVRGAWSFLNYKHEEKLSDALFVAPVATFMQRSEDIESVSLFRDEMANVVWGVERQTEGELGRGIDRAQALDRARPALFAPPSAEVWRYRLRTRVPENWFALTNVPLTPKMLALSVVSPSTAEPVGRLLPSPVDDVPTAATGQVYEEEVPREGVRLARADVMARWMDGSTVLWRRHERAVGRGEGSSGLAFDITLHESAT